MARNRLGRACVQLGMMPHLPPARPGARDPLTAAACASAATACGAAIHFRTHVDTAFTHDGCSGARWTKIGQICH